jgi:acyl-CoA synthetase (NDP forming)
LNSRNMDALEALFNPKGIAVIGASANVGKWGYIVPANILSGGYKGELFLVNPRGGEVHSMPVYRSMAEIGKRVDLAMVTIPAQGVEGLLEDCAQAGVKAIIVISGGFSESSREGLLLEEGLAKKAGELGVRIVGPNTMGIYSAPWSLNALMPPVRPHSGHIAFAAQSGNLGTQMLGWGSYRGIGFSRFVCVGNQCDIDFADYLEYFASDDETRVILLYVEGFKRARHMLELAEEVSPSKPVVIYKAGDTRAGGRAASSHSAALAGSREIYQGMMRQGGMIQAETTEEMLDFSDALVKMPIPRGRRVAILTWGGGWGVVTADLCERDGLEVTPLPDALKEELGDILPSYWSKGNPVDLVGIVDLDMHRRCLELMAASPAYDAVISLGTINAASAFGLREQENDKVDEEVVKVQKKYVHVKSTQFAQRAVELMREFSKPIVTVGMPERDVEIPGEDDLPREDICVYTNPERAARVAAMLAERGEYIRSRGV